MASPRPRAPPRPVERSQPPLDPVLATQDEIDEWLDEAGDFDVVVGINARNVETTIIHVLNVVCMGLQEHLPGLRPLVIVCDGSSDDSTVPMAQFFPAPEGVRKVVVRQLHGPGKGNGVRTVLEIADRVGAQASACVDGDLVSIHPSWIGKMLDPVLYGLTDLVVPYYLRDKWDGVITNHLCYPFTASLYGTSVRQPIGGDYSFSRRFIQHVLDDGMPGDFGIDIYLTTAAISEGFRMQEAPLGLKVHASTTEYTDPKKVLSKMYLEVVGTLINLAARYENVWRHPEVRQPVLTAEAVIPFYGRLPPGTKINEDVMRGIYLEGVEEHDELLGRILPADVYQDMRQAGEQGLSAETWARLVYGVAAWHLSHDDAAKRRPDENLLHALGALGMGRFLRFVSETREMSLQEAFDHIREQADAFSQAKAAFEARIEHLRRPGTADAEDRRSGVSESS